MIILCNNSTKNNGKIITGKGIGDWPTHIASHHGTRFGKTILRANASVALLFEVRIWRTYLLSY